MSAEKRPAQPRMPPPRPPPLPPLDTKDPGERLRRVLSDSVDNLARTIEQMKHEASQEIIRRAAMELPRAIDRLVLQRYKRLTMLHTAIWVFAGVSGVWLGRWLAHQGF